MMPLCNGTEATQLTSPQGAYKFLMQVRMFGILVACFGPYYEP